MSPAAASSAAASSGAASSALTPTAAAPSAAPPTAIPAAPFRPDLNLRPSSDPAAPDTSILTLAPPRQGHEYFDRLHALLGSAPLALENVELEAPLAAAVSEPPSPSLDDAAAAEALLAQTAAAAARVEAAAAAAASSTPRNSKADGEEELAADRALADPALASISILKQLCAVMYEDEGTSAAPAPSAAPEPPPTANSEGGEGGSGSTDGVEGGGVLVDRHVGWSDDMLVALGAQIALGEFVAGRTTLRLQSACSRLAEWLEEAQRPSCTSLLFRIRSWHETAQVEPDSDLSSFVCGKAVLNRQMFYGQLCELQQAADGHTYVAMLYELVSKLRRPCLRMRMLQEVLGLDHRFSRDITFGVICLAFDIVESIARGAPAPPALHGLDLDGFDEATRLEADTLFRSERERPTDPCGEDRRRSRMLVDGRHS